MTPTPRNSLECTHRAEEMTMMTVNEVSKLTGVSIRTLQYYDTIGLLKPSGYTASGYRLYDDTALERLQQILLFKEHLENLILFARKIKTSGANKMDFNVFNIAKMDEYARQAKEQWGQTAAYREYEEKTKNQSSETQKAAWKNLMLIFVAFGKIKDKEPDNEEVQLLVKQLQDYISEHFYQCSNEILKGLGKMYASGGEFTENIDKAGGAGTAAFVAEAIEVYTV